MYRIIVTAFVSAVLVVSCSSPSGGDSAPPVNGLADLLPNSISFEPMDVPQSPDASAVVARADMGAVENAGDGTNDGSFSVNDLAISFFDYYKPVIVDELLPWIKQRAEAEPDLDVVQATPETVVDAGDSRLPDGYAFVVDKIKFTDSDANDGISYDTVLMYVSIANETDTYMSLEIRINVRESEWSWISRNQRYPEAVTDVDPHEYWYWIIEGDLETGDAAFLEIIKFEADDERTIAVGPQTRLISRTLNSHVRYDLFDRSAGQAAHEDEGGGTGQPSAVYGINRADGFYLSGYAYDGTEWSLTGVALFDENNEYIGKSEADPFEISDGSTTWSVATNWAEGHDGFIAAAEVALQSRVTTDTAAAEEGLLLPDSEFVGFQD